MPFGSLPLYPIVKLWKELRFQLNSCIKIFPWVSNIPSYHMYTPGVNGLISPISYSTQTELFRPKINVTQSPEGAYNGCVGVGKRYDQNILSGVHS